MSSLPNPAELRSVSILGTGSYLPKRVMTNDDLSKLVETNDEWIRSRTGIRERRIAEEHETASDMGEAAARAALEQAGVRPEEIDLIIVSTSTPDMQYPTTACYLQAKLGAKKGPAFDMGAACSGFPYALETGKNFIATGMYKYVLVVATEKTSAVMDWKDRNTCVLFGDGAGAAVLGHRPGSRGFISSDLGADGTAADILYLSNGGTRLPPGEVTESKLTKIQMAGREVYKQAVAVFPESVHKVIEMAGLQPEQVRMIIPHQANVRIIQSVAERLGLPMERFFLNLDRYGNTSSAAAAIALDEAHRTKQFGRGDYVLITAFGGGLTWASQLIEW
jgi:3-oxoacyl-[acyl-carrier-protein] synthase-3